MVKRLGSSVLGHCVESFLASPSAARSSDQVYHASIQHQGSSPPCTTVPHRLPSVSGREVRSSLGIRTSPYRLAGPLCISAVASPMKWDCRRLCERARCRVSAVAHAYCGATRVSLMGPSAAGAHNDRRDGGAEDGAERAEGQEARVPGVDRRRVHDWGTGSSALRPTYPLSVCAAPAVL